MHLLDASNEIYYYVVRVMLPRKLDLGRNVGHDYVFDAGTQSKLMVGVP